MSGTEANGTATIDQEQWAAPMDTSDGQEHAGEAALESANGDRPLDAGSPSRGSVAGGVAESLPGSKSGTIYREKQVKPNKVYVGGLPEHTRQEDLQSCFSKIGHVVSIELKLGYGFVEFETEEAAIASVEKYHEGFFMGNKIRVERSHGGGKTAKYTAEPGACFKCGQQGHWARECPNHVVTISSHHQRGSRPPEPTLLDRISQPGGRDYRAPPPPAAREYAGYRDDPRYGPPSYDRRFGYDYPPVPPARDPRDYPRPPRTVTPPPGREYRDYPPVVAPPPRSRDYDEFRREPYRPGPPAVPPPPSRYEGRAPYYPDYDHPPPPREGAYPPRPPYSGPPPPARDTYDRYAEKRSGPPPPPGERYPPYPPPGVRPRTPPSATAARVPLRDDYDRPPRDYPPPPPAEYRGRASPPPGGAARYPDPANGARYRRRSQSPPAARAAPGAYREPHLAPPVPDSAGYPPPPPGYANGYSRPPPPPRGRGDRDFMPPAGRAERNGTAETTAAGGGPGYNRRP